MNTPMLSYQQPELGLATNGYITDLSFLDGRASTR